MDEAEKFEWKYWYDQQGRYGYRAYKYIPGYWKPVAEKLIAHYGLEHSSRVLDVGCGMGFLLTEIGLLLPGADLIGFDISKVAVAGAMPGTDVREYDARKPFPFDDNYFDLVISLGCLHNLLNYERESPIREIDRVGRRKFIMVEGYQNNRELTNLQQWGMTCKVWQRPDEWIYEYRRLGYTGDCEFIYFE